MSHKLLFTLWAPVCLWAQTLPTLPICLDADIILMLENPDSQVKIKHSGHLWLAREQHMLRLSTPSHDWILQDNHLTWVDHRLKQVLHYHIKERAQPLLSWLLHDQWQGRINYYHDHAQQLNIDFISHDERQAPIETQWHEHKLKRIQTEDERLQRWTLTLNDPYKERCPLPEQVFTVTIPSDYDQP